MLVDSHCHLNSIDLSEFNNSLENVLLKARENGVEYCLSVCVDLKDYPTLCDIAEKYPNISISVGVHPNEESEELSVELLQQLARHPACVAIGETGLDYFRVESETAQMSQRDHFRIHINAALQSSKPLIIHTRQASTDTLLLMREEKANEVGGVMHCFTEDWEVAKKALDMNFYISLSGIVSFKSAVNVHDVAKKVPLDRLLIETDSPYLAPVPFRGKQNHPALVKHVALAISELRQMSYEKLAEITTKNFYKCFNIASKR